MKDIYELSKFVTKNIELLDVLMPRDENSPLNRFKNIVLRGNQESEKAIMKEIYGKENLQAFSKLKIRFKEILIQCLISQKLAHESFNSRINQNYNHLRQGIAFKLLIDLKSHGLAIQLAEKSINSAIKYHLSDVVVMYCRLLVRHYGASEFNWIKYNKYLKLEKQYLNIQKWEIKSERYFHALQTKHLNSFSEPNENTLAKAKRYSEKLNKVAHVDSYIFKLNKFRVDVVYCEYTRDYLRILKLSDDIFNEFGPLFRSTTFNQIVLTRKMWALIQLGKYEEAILNGKSLLEKVLVGSLGWYYFTHYTIKAQLYNLEYDQSIRLVSQAIDHPNFGKIGGNLKEVFKATLGYIHLIVESGLAGNPETLKQNLPEFKLYKFLNAIPVFSKDKRGLNVSILLMHIGFLLLRKDYNAIIDRVDSLNYYANRHLRKDDTFRSNCMIKMVIQMTNADFNPVRTVRYTEDLFKKLQDVKLAGSGENIETEIIPYEVLWQIMLKACDTNYSKKRSKVIG